MASFSAADVVGRTLTANTPVNLKRLPMDSAPVIYTVAAGQPVGVVDSWISPGPNNNKLYWSFLDQNKKPFYAEHVEGRYSIKGLTEQGAQTTQEKTNEANAADEPLKDFIAKNILKIVGIAAAAYAAAKILPSIINKR